MTATSFESTTQGYHHTGTFSYLVYQFCKCFSKIKVFFNRNSSI